MKRKRVHAADWFESQSRFWNHVPECLDIALEQESDRFVRVRDELKRIETTLAGNPDADADLRSLTKKIDKTTKKLDSIYQALRQLSANHTTLLANHRQFARNIIGHLCHKNNLDPNTPTSSVISDPFKVV